MQGPTNAGGSASAKGFIQTTYPEGFICTCSNGTRTLKARDASGYMMFILPAIGTWTVTATDPADPTNTDSETVEIIKEGETVSVELSYALWLFKDGDQCVNLTGGWYSTVYDSKGTATIDDTLYVNCTAAGTYGAALSTRNTIDFSKINTLYFNVTSISGSGTQVLISSDVAANANAIVLRATITTSGLVAVDVSEVNGGYYLHLTGNAQVGGGGTKYDQIYGE